MQYNLGLKWMFGIVCFFSGSYCKSCIPHSSPNIIKHSFVQFEPQKYKKLIKASVTAFLKDFCVTVHRLDI